MKTLILGGLIAVLAAGLVVPAQTLAGDKEWATAGKILAGVVALGVLTDGLQSDSCGTSERVVVREVYRPPVVVYKSCRGCRAGACRDHGRHRRQNRGPAIRYYDRHRRIGHSRHYGYRSEVRHWSPCGQRRVVVRRHWSRW